MDTLNPLIINHDSPVNHPYKLAMWWGGAYLISDTLKCDIHSLIVHPHPPIVSPMISTVLSPFKGWFPCQVWHLSPQTNGWSPSLHVHLLPLGRKELARMERCKLRNCRCVITQKHWKPCWKQDRHQNWFKQFINLSNENCDISREYAKNMWLRDARCNGSRRNVFGEVSPCRSWMVLPHLDENPGDPGEM